MNRTLTLIAAMLAAAGIASAQCISLEGDWSATTDSVRGATVRLPGTLDMAGVGAPNALEPAMTKPQLLRLTRKVSYIGPCTYSREIDIPRDMAGKPLRLTMERVLWKSTVKVDGHQVGADNISLNSPHTYELPPLTAGKHLLEVTIDNRRQRDISFDNLCHSYTNDTQTMWNGVLGRFTLCVIPDVEVGRPQVYANAESRSMEVAVPIDNRTGRRADCEVHLTVADKQTGRVVARKRVKYPAASGQSTLRTTISVPKAELWSEFTPVLYTLDARIGDSESAVQFGFRDVRSEGKSLYVNGNKVFLRGSLDCCVFPLTGVPPTDREGWVKEMTTLKDWGFNHIRFHSWCPPEAAFEVADSLGLYLQTELPVWALTIGDDPKVTEYLYDEFDNMSQAYGNHPSWIMSTCGNELQHDFGVLNALVSHMRQADPRHLYAATSFTFEKGHGGHAEPFDQFLITQWTDDGWVRGQGVFDAEPPSFDKNYASAMGCVEVPLVSHEIGQYAVYPDMNEIDKYTGVLDPLNFKAIRVDLQAKGLLDKAQPYLQSTSAFARLLYKEEIERALKTPGFSGYQLLGIQDFPGQGTALVGLLDAFWDAKGDMKGEDFASFNAPVVPLASFPKAVYDAGEDFDAKALVSNFGPDALEGSSLWWTLTDADGTALSGTIDAPVIEQGTVAEAGSIHAPLAGFKAPSKLVLSMGIEGTDYANSWNIWVYPREAETAVPAGVTVANNLAKARAALERGEKVLFMPAAESVQGIESKFLPVFWSPVHFPKQAGGMGVLADAAHPALQGFPNDGHSDWQWWQPVKNARVMLLDSLTDLSTGAPVEPIVGVVDNFYRNRRLGYVFEARCGKGTILVSSINLDAPGPEMRSLKQGILRYMASDAFSPKNEIDFAQIESIAGAEAKIENTNATSIYQ